MRGVRIDACGIEGCAGIDGPAIVIDVIRAFTVAAWAFERGAERIVLSNDVSEALRLKSELGAIAINDGMPDDDFDLVNSPEHVAATDLSGRTVVLRTEAGTRGALAARHAPVLLCTGLATATATAKALLALDVDRVTLVATGGDDDVACAEYLTCLLRGDDVDPGPFVERVRSSDVAEAMREYVRRGIAAVGPRDVDLACEVDRFGFAMRATDQGGLLTLVRSDQT